MILITEIRPYKRTKLFEVYSEEQMEFLASEKFLLQHEIARGETFDDEEFETIRAKAHLLDGIRKATDILSRKDYSKKELIDKLLKDDVSLNGLNKQLIKADKVYIGLLEKGKEADLSLLQEKQMQVLFKSMSDLPSIIRTVYAREILTGDKDKAQKLRERFEINAKSYPYTGEIESERDLMELVKV